MQKAVLMIEPPQHINNEILRQMFELNKKFETSKALEYTPHITLKSIGFVDYKKADEIVDIVGEMVKPIKPIILTAEGLRYYGSNQGIDGIYINVQKTPGIMNLHRKSVKILKRFEDKDRNYKEKDNFNPHITLVGDDITKENLAKAKKSLRRKKVYYKFPVDEVSLTGIEPRTLRFELGLF